METEAVADLDHLAIGNPDMGPRAIVRGVAVRDEGVQAVVATRQLDDDEDALGVALDARALQRLRGERSRRAGQEHRQRRADADAVQPAREKVASRTATRHSTPHASSRVGIRGYSTRDTAARAAPV